MNNVLIFVMLSIFISSENCSTEKPYNYKITRYQRVDEGCHYSKDFFTYKSNVYRPIITAKYISDTLISVFVYKSEGKMNYSRADIDADSLLFQMLNTPVYRPIEIIKNQVIDNGKLYQITGSIKDSMYCLQKDTLILYILDQNIKAPLLGF